jgi:polyhydroxybutyrate depolymerase
VLALAVAMLVLGAASGCRVGPRDDTGAPVAAVDGTSPPAAPQVPSADLYAGTEPASAAAGHVVLGMLPAPGGRWRGYRLYVPASLEDGSEAPLLIALHGGGGSAEQFERTAGLDGLAESNRFLVVYPDGVGSGPNGARLRTWNAGTCCGAAAEQQVDDVGFVDRLITAVSTAQRVDGRRVFAMGHSNGAMLAYRLACELSERVAAVALQAGSLAIDDCRPPVPVSLLHLHGTGDQNVPIDGGHGPRSVSGVDYRPASRSVAAVAGADGCTTTPSPVDDKGSSDLTFSMWAGCPPGVSVGLVTVDGASHAWMGHDRGPVVEGLVGEPYAELDASRALWAFLAAHPRT